MNENDPLFFVSYAHSRRGNRARLDNDVRDFFEELSDDVAEHVPRSVGAEPGFMDGLIESGGKWTPELLQAVGTCQTFVALLSPPYLSSSWCGQEWCAFSRREVRNRVTGKPGIQTAMLPVIWVSWPNATRIPPAVSRVQRFRPEGLPSDDHAVRYREYGLLGLKRAGERDAYSAIVWRLAKRIAEIHAGHEVDPLIPEREELLDIFREPA